MPIRDYAGAAKQARLTADCDATDLTAACDDLDEWPDGGANGKFFVTFENNELGEERTLAASRSGNTLTFSGLGDRGLEGTAAILHPTGTTVQHTFSATEAEEANQHIFNTALDHHTQYLNNARHDITSRHAYGAALGTPGTPVQLTPDTAATAGTGAAPAREDHRHLIAAATAVTSGLANAEGVSTSFARADHTHDQDALSIGTGELVDLGVTTAKIADLNVTSGKLANLGVTSGKLAADSVIAGKIAAGAIDNAADIVDNLLPFAKILSAASVDFSASVTFTNPSGNFILDEANGGIKYANYYKIGRIVLYWVHFRLGTVNGNISGAGTLIEVNLPFACRAAGRGFAAARARESGGTTVWSGTTAVGEGASIATNFASAGASATWDGDTPFNWAPNDTFDAIIIYEAAA